MPCYHPIPGWWGKERNPSGKRSIVFRLGEGFRDRPTSVPCGTCIGCRLERSRQWAVRCMHEASLYDANCFVTFTYAESPGSLRKKDFTDFLKRLRWHLGTPVRYFQCGEYGEQFSRPHHHALLFNVWFPDSRPYLKSGQSLFVSSQLDKLWGHGRCVIGLATFNSAAYIARYTLKKVVGPAAEGYYQGREPEYLTMSRRPGIGHGYVERYGDEVYRFDSLRIRGHECKPPRYYDNVMASRAPELLARIRLQRGADAKNSVDNTPRRLLIREEVKQASVKTLKRNLEEF